MRLKLQERAFQRVASTLQPGEQAVVATRASVGMLSSGRLAGIATNTLAIGGGGLLGAALASTKKQFVVLTNRRLIFLPQNFLGGPGKKILGEVPGEQVALAEARIGVVSLVRIAFGAEGDGVALTLPLQDKKNAKMLAEALRQSTDA